MKFIFTTYLLLFTSIVFSQSDTSNYFGAPLTIPMYLAGNFGEIRSGHFHAGIDIKTQQVEGMPVIAAADGFVSRIKISLGGYGKALYITHPNGYTTAYGHLQKFNDEINSVVLAKQYAEKSFTTELYLTANRIEVKKGDTIALSGNTGGSGGPHLHFEIRKTAGSVPQNPLKFGFDIKDNIAPIIKNIAIYPLNDTSSINGKREVLVIPTKKYGSKYILTHKGPLKAQGVIGFGIEAIDKLNGAGNRCGAYNITLQTDSQTIYSHQMDEIGFDVTRFINTHVDFYQWKKKKKRVQKSYLNSYNKLKIYRDVKNKGMVYFSKYGHQLHYDVYDVYGNSTSIDFNVSVDTAIYNHPQPVTPTGVYFNFKSANHFENEAIKIDFPAYSFYENIYFDYKKEDSLPNGYSNVHRIQNLYSPLQKYMTVSINAQQLDSAIQNKVYAVSLNKDLKVISPEGGGLKDGWIVFRTRSLGPYTLLVDTVPPTIKPLNFKTSAPNIDHAKNLTFIAKDSDSGVAQYTAQIDGEWCLMELDSKTGVLSVDLQNFKLNQGPHTLSLKIGDSLNNFKTFTFDFIW